MAKLPEVNHSYLNMSTTLNRAGATMVYMETLGERLKKLRSSRNETQEQVAQLAGVSKVAISKIEASQTKDPGVSTIEPIIRHYGVNLRWLAFGEGPKMSNPAIPNDLDDWADVKGVKQPAALGDGAEPDEYAETHKLKFRLASLQRKKLKADRLAVIYGKGDSMYPTIKDGDAILIDTTDREPKDDKLFVITYGRDLFAKRLISLGGKWFIDSDNKSDPKWKRPIPIDDAQGFEIHGRVRWIGSWED